MKLGSRYSKQPKTLCHKKLDCELIRPIDRNVVSSEFGSRFRHLVEGGIELSINTCPFLYYSIRICNWSNTILCKTELWSDLSTVSFSCVYAYISHFSIAKLQRYIRGDKVLLLSWHNANTFFTEPLCIFIIAVFSAASFETSDFS